MNSKNLLGWVVLATWIFAWCSNNNEVKEINGTLADSITVIKNSVNNNLMEIVNQDAHNYRKKYIRRKKIPLLDECNNIVKPITKKENKDSTINRGTKLINMYEAWLEDGDEMKKHLEQNNDYEYHIWRFIVDYSEREDNQKIQDYDLDEDYLFFRKIK